MKMLEKINHYRKDFVHRQYTRIVPDFKDYEKISKTKMISAIYDMYNSDYNNIIEICTTRELKYLKMILNSKMAIKGAEEYKKNIYNPAYKYQYEWERKTLRQKFLIEDINESIVPEEIVDSVKSAIDKVNTNSHKKQDEINEILIGFIKTQGDILLQTFLSIGSYLTDLKKEEIEHFIFNNKLFRYYVYITTKDIENLGNDICILISEDYYEIADEIDEQRKLQAISSVKNFDVDAYRTIFYNDFNINNPKIKKFIDEAKKIPIFWNITIDTIKEYAMLNLDRKQLKEKIMKNIFLQNKDLTKILVLMDKAMDEMPSGALNGLTPNEYRKIKKETIEYNKKHEKNYQKQINAHITENDKKLFYKLYFALLEFTNKKYNINSNVKIYKQQGINPYEIKDIIEKFWENKNNIILEFTNKNSYNFNKEELEIIDGFKKGIRRIYIIGKFDKEYTSFITEDKIYMVKGLTSNIDEIISYKDLPYPIITTLIPFKGNIIYDGILEALGISMGNGFKEQLDKEYNTLKKYYHL